MQSEVQPPPPPPLPPPPYSPPCKDCETPKDPCCSQDMCRGLVTASMVFMVLIIILCIVWFALDFTDNINQADDAWFAMGTFILAFIGMILMLVWDYRCNKCFICTG